MQSNKPMAGFGVGPDWETFQRVWKRVMPDEENSPIRMRDRPEEEGAMPPPREEKPHSELEEMMAWLYTGTARAEGQAGRAGTPAVWKQLYQQRRQALRQLGTVYFLQTGTRCRPSKPSKGSRNERLDLSHMLRREYLWEEHWGELCRRYARGSRQTELGRVCSELAKQSQQRGELIRRTLERME